MKSRILLPLLLLLVVVLFGGYFVASRVFNVNQRARDYLTGKASEFLGGDFKASSVFILPWSITIRDAQLKLKDTPLEISVKRVRIGFSLFEFIKNGFKPMYGTEQVYLDRPEFIWNKGLQPLAYSVSDSSSGTFTVEKVPVLPVGNIPRMRININKGVLGVRTNGEYENFADGISGWLDASLSTVINLNLEGSVLSGQKNMTLTGSLNREKNSYAVDLRCNDCDLTHEKFAGLIRDKNIGILGGILTLSAHIKQENKDIAIQGNISVEHGFLQLKKYGIDVKDVSIAATADENEVVFNTISASVLNVAPVLTGKLVLRPDITLQLNIKARNVDLATILSDIYPEHESNLSGSVNVDATVEGPLANKGLRPLVLIAECTADSIDYKTYHLDHVSARLHVEGNKLEVNEATALYKDYAIRAQGNADLAANASKKAFSVALTATHRTNKKDAYSLKLTGFAQPKKAFYKADIQLKYLFSDFPEYFSLAGNLTLADETLDFFAGNKVVTMKGTAKNIFKQPEIISTVECNNLSLLNYFGYAGNDVVIDGIGTLRGTIERLQLDGDFKLAAYSEVNTNVRGRVYTEKPFTPSRRFDVAVQLTDLLVHDSHPMLLKLNAIADSLGACLNVVDDDGVSLVVDADVNTGTINGHCDLQEFPLERIIDIFRQEKTGYTGRLTGRAEIGGTLKDPVFTTPQPIAVSNLNIGRNLDRLSGVVRAYGKIGELTFSDVHVSRDGIPVMNAYGSWVSGEPFILNAQGEAIQLGAISDIISSDRKTDGRADYKFSMVFTRKSGTIDGDFSLHNGHFFDIPIDEARGVLGGGSTGFTVTDFMVKKDGLYEGKGSATSGYLWKDETESPGLRMNLALNGDLVRAIPYLTDSIKKATGKCQLNVVVGGTWQDPVVIDGELYVTDATIEPAFLVKKITDVTAILKIEPDVTTMSGYSGVRVRVGNGMVNNKKLVVQNVHIGDKEWGAIKRPHLVSVVNGDVSLDFGVITGQFENTRGRSRDNTVELHIPGFMESNETGKFELTGDANGRFFVGAAQGDEGLTPYISGKVMVRSGEITYPLLPVSTKPEDTGFLEDIFWDIQFSSGQSVYYFNEVNQQWRILGTTVSRTLAKLDENSWFKIFGRLSDGSFRVTGNARSTSGSVSYFGADFNIEQAEFDVDTSREERPSILTGRAQTVVFDSTGVQTEIYLNVSTVDTNPDQVRRAPGRAEVVYGYGDIRRFEVQGLGTLQIVFSSTDPTDDTQEKILAKLGISSEKFGSTAARAFTSGFDSYYMSRWFRPFEDIIRKYTKLDVIQFTPSVLGNIMKSRLGFSQRFAPESNYMLFDETRIVLGESIFKELFLSYQGEYGLSRDFLSRRERGFYHEIGLQYNLKRNTRLQLKYFYDDVIKEGERRFEIRHDFTF